MKRKLIFISMMSILLLTNCEIEKSNPTNLVVNFSHTIDGITLVLGSGCTNGGECLPDHSCCIGGHLLPYTNTLGEKYNVQTLKYLISDIILHKENGNNDTIKDVHYIDASNRSTLFFDAGEISNGTYTNVSFTMGLDTTKNISNLYVNENFHSSMFWPDMMGGGYHYMKIEGAYNNDSTFYNTHTGGTMGIDYSFKNKFEISLNTTDEDKIAEINFNMEINNWYQNPNSINLEPTIMNDMTKQGQLQNNGIIDVFSIETYAGRR